MADWDTIWIHANLATMAGTSAPYGQIENGAIAVTGDRIAWVGAMDTLPGKPDALANDVVDVAGKWITPGLIDCHTHLVFGGSRAGEFEQRLQGVSYEEIARAGGGIVSTMTATREASEDALVRAGPAAPVQSDPRRLHHGRDKIRLRPGEIGGTQTAFRGPRAGENPCR